MSLVLTSGPRTGEPFLIGMSSHVIVEVGRRLEPFATGGPIARVVPLLGVHPTLVRFNIAPLERPVVTSGPIASVLLFDTRMYFYVFVQTIDNFEALPADLALERPFVRMVAFVSLQPSVALSLETTARIVAHELLPLSLSGVRLLVIRQIVSNLIGLVAALEVANVRPFLRMSLNVFIQ